MTLVGACLVLGLLASGDDSPEGKALAYLSVEVPRWSTEHHCYSCHNNGDGARALYSAIRLGRAVPPGATLGTDRWLARPDGWDRNGGDGPFSDKVLARVQFAASLASATEAGRVEGREALTQAAARLAEDQAEDGSWPIEDSGRVGTPATYGPSLVTWTAREVLRSADPSKYQARVDRADAWLRLRPIASVMDASTALLARAFDDSAEGRDRRGIALGLIRRGQSPEGGWGPFDSSPPEAFDTALALLALDRYRDRDGAVAMIAKGRAYLVATQRDDGSWSETTRPSGNESYAQRISTTGWATRALLEVKER